MQRWMSAWTRVGGTMLCLALIASIGCSSGETKQRIIILTNGPDPFWDTCEAGAKAAERELGLADQGYVVDFQRGDFTSKKQIDMLKQYALAPDVVAVGISVFDPDSLNLAEEMRGLQEQGVRVITIDSDVDREKYRDARYGYLGTDNIVGGRELGRAAAKVAAEDGARFAFFVGDKGVANAKERMAGFLEGISAGSVEVARLDDGGDRPKARKNVEDVLNEHPEVNMLVGIWAYNTPQIINVVDDRGIREATRIICFDAAERAISGMEDGMVDVMVVQNPYQMGYDGVKLMHALVADDKSVTTAMYPNYAQTGENDLYRTELRVVVPDGETAITADLFEPETKFFKSADFKKWLQERGLISS
ncbi:MAG: substrate-binding domain-containing protein [Planctomycetaceae bacterium]